MLDLSVQRVKISPSVSQTESSRKIADNRDIGGEGSGGKWQSNIKIVVLTFESVVSEGKIFEQTSWNVRKGFINDPRRSGAVSIMCYNISIMKLTQRQKSAKS